MFLPHAFSLGSKEVIALSGGGGKTTLMFRLATELTAAGQRVVTTMTTRIFVSQMAQAPLAFVLHGEGALLAQLPEALAEHRHVLIAGGTMVEQDKAEGVPPEFLDRIAAQPAVDVVIVEADGSRRLPFKAPAQHEPVIPIGTTVLVPVVGLDVVGKPLVAGQVHRPELVAALSGAKLGDPVTPEMMAAVLAHPEGGAKGLPPGARLVPFLNKVEDEATLAAARQIARRLLAHPIVDRVIIGAAQAADPVIEVWGRVGAVVLAAGQGSRFGALKQVLPWQGVPLVAHVAGQALACPDIDSVVVTIGAGAGQVETALAGRRVDLVPVPDWADGQSRSVQTGLGALAGASAVIFLLADQPGVSPALLAALVRRHRETLAPVVAPRYRGQRGNPVLFDRATFPEFARLIGDVGARPIIQAHPDEIAWVDWPTPEITQDIDVAGDYRPELA
ncbi:MAG: selenium cofactor biosynthesis protein YqeC [Anaerolineae bacterium]|nr:selenium cofactor biosynthesis protein YqeC [Anaerolineae bacterium]